jgi:hypothetical protein
MTPRCYGLWAAAAAVGLVAVAPATVAAKGPGSMVRPATTLVLAGGRVERDERPVDRHAYEYRPRGYYPYYNSSQWKPLEEMRAREKPVIELPPYAPAWGYPREWDHRRWHRENHGLHWPHHW